MKPKHLEKLLNKKVIVTYRGLQLIGKYVGIEPRFGGRDALIKLPGIKKPKRFWAAKIQPIE